MFKIFPKGLLNAQFTTRKPGNDEEPSEAFTLIDNFLKSDEAKDLFNTDLQWGEGKRMFNSLVEGFL